MREATVHPHAHEKAPTALRFRSGLPVIGTAKPNLRMSVWHCPTTCNVFGETCRKYLPNCILHYAGCASPLRVRSIAAQVLMVELAA